MVAYTKEEIVSSTVLARTFSSILNKLKDHTLDKVAILRNNEMEAVIVPIKEYEIMQSFIEQAEIKNLYELIKARELNPLSDYLSLDDLNKNIDV